MSFSDRDRSSGVAECANSALPVFGDFLERGPSVVPRLPTRQLSDTRPNGSPSATPELLIYRLARLRGGRVMVLAL
jgi:hypothetical protein